jgi:hypothetical protein
VTRHGAVFETVFDEISEDQHVVAHQVGFFDILPRYGW